MKPKKPKDGFYAVQTVHSYGSSGIIHACISLTNAQNHMRSMKNSLVGLMGLEVARYERVPMPTRPNQYRELAREAKSVRAVEKILKKRGANTSGPLR